MYDNNSVEEEIKKYIDSEETNGALLVTGKWGCGKSYLIKNLANKINAEENRKTVVAFVSMFGIDAADQLEKEFSRVVLSEVFNTNDSKIKKIVVGFLEKARNFTGQISDVSDKAKALNTVMNTVFEINIFDYIDFPYALKCIGSDKEYKLVLVFDDFERCGIEIETRMGLINDYVENRGIKVIIIADEEHISEPKYKEFKEKLIFRTVMIGKDNYDIATTIISNFKGNTKYIDYLKEHKEKIAQTFIESRTDNLRFLKSFLIDFERIFDEWPQDVPKDENIVNIMIDFAIILFENRAGRYQKMIGSIYSFTRTDDMNKEQKFLHSFEKYTYYNRKYELVSLKEWVVDSKWDNKAFWKELREKFIPEQMSCEQIFLNTSIFDYEQDQFEKDFCYVLEQLYNGKLICNDVLVFLRKLKFMEENDISFPCEIDYEKIVLGIDKRKDAIKNNPNLYIPITHNYDRNDFSELHKGLYDKIKKMEYFYSDILSKKELLEYFSKRANDEMASMPFQDLYCIDEEFINSFFDCYKRSSSSTKNEFIDVIKSISLNLKNDDKNITAQALNKLMSMIRTATTNDSKLIVNAINRKLIEAIKELMQKYNLE